MKQKSLARILAAAAAVALALTACSATPPALLKADGVERVSADRAAYQAELAQLRASARQLGAASWRTVETPETGTWFPPRAAC